MLYHTYIFFDTRKNRHDLGEDDFADYKKEFIALIEKNKKVVTFGYSTLGLKAGSRFMLWFQSDEIERIQDLLNSLLHTRLGRYLKISYTLFGMIRASQYSRNRPTTGAVAAETNAGEKAQVIDAGAGGIREKYLIIYPFTKTKEWHLMDFETRKKIMIDHMKTGHKHAPIKQQLLYAYGIDDHEFIVSYETQALADFQSLVMELRGTEGRRYTENDLPIYTCVYHPLTKVLDVI
jgi:chlorite dismutase